MKLNGRSGMKKCLTFACAGALTATMLLASACGEVKADYQAPAYSSPDATITLSGSIDKTTASQQVSSDLFGIFLEDINYAGYALDDNLVCNGSFEYLSSNKPYGWTAEDISLAATTEDSLFAENAAFSTDTNPTAASLTVTSANGTLKNTGYTACPMAVQTGVQYTFSAFIKATDYNGSVKVELTDGSASYASATLSVEKSESWVKYSATLTATGTESSGVYLLLTFASEGSLLLDSVTLETGDSTAGFKNYLYDAIADLTPSFVRFPGGCVAEGTNDEEVYDWKSSIGATTVTKTVDGTTIADTVPAFEYTLIKDGVQSSQTTYGEQATRNASTDIWQSGTNYYEMEYGIGFYEYFLLCDSIGASAIPVVSCGMSCQTQGSGTKLSGRHGNGISDFIQDALDLVAFAKGSVDSSDPNEAYWAQVRTDMGHPEPFEMDYIGIGNEQWDSYYTVYYEKFLEAFMDAAEENSLYGSVQLIVGNCTLFEHCEYPETETGSHRTGVAQAAAQTYLSKSGSYISSVSEYGVVDQHYYMNYTDFLYLAQEDFYAGYSRPADDPEGYYNVFVGEYSANSYTLRADETVGSEGATTNDESSYRFTYNSWLAALSEAALMTTFESNGDIVKLAAYAPMFGNLKSENNQWAVNMMFYNNTNVVLTPNYYVQQLFMQNSGDHKVTSSIAFASDAPQTTYTGTKSETRTIDDVYYVTTADEETGDIIIKIVNAGETKLNMNVALGGLSVKLKGIADVVELKGAEPSDTSALNAPALFPSTYTIGSFTNGTLGFEVQPYSVTAIRVRTK